MGPIAGLDGLEKTHISCTLPGSNTNSNCNNGAAFVVKMFGTISNVSFMRVEQQMEHISICVGNVSKRFGLLLQRCAFNFCVTYNFLPVYLCDHSHNLCDHLR